MARIGENIQAGLGRVDYSPLAQGIIAGGQARAQGIASLGQAASTAITAYFKRKEEDQRISSEIQSLKSLSQRPGGKAILEPLNIFKDDGSFDDATATALIRERGLNGVVTLGSALKDLERQAKLETTNKKAIDYSSILEMGGGRVPAPYSNDFIKKGFTPEERALGRDMYVKQQTQGVQLDLARSQIAENLAQARAAGMPKVETPGVEEAQVRAAMRAEAQRVNRQLTAAEEDAIRTRVAESRRSSTTFDMGQKGKERENVFNQFKDERKASIEPILKSDRASRRLGELLDSGKLIAGSTANIELPIKSIANDLGVGDFPEARNTQEYMALIGQAVARNISAFGAGTAISNADREYAERISGGDITVTPEVLRRLQQILNDASRDTLEQYNSRLSDVFGSDDVYYKSLRVRENDAPFFFGKVATKPVAGTITRDGKIVGN